MNPVTNKVFATNLANNTVTVIDGDINATSTLGPGSNPFGVAVNPVTNKIYVTNSVTDSDDWQPAGNRRGHQRDDHGACREQSVCGSGESCDQYRLCHQLSFRHQRQRDSDQWRGQFHRGHGDLRESAPITWR